MNFGPKCSKTVLQLSKTLATLRLSRNLHQRQSYLSENIPIVSVSNICKKVTADNCGAFKSLNLTKNVELELTAKFWASQVPQTQTIEDPVLKIPFGKGPGNEAFITPTKNSLVIEEPVNNVIEKKAHRRLIIRKRKMKVHRRKRRWKRNWVMYRKGYLDREKKREIAFRQKMIVKVNEANTFDARKYVDDYLEDAKYELVPKTYEGKRLPQWLIKNLLEEDEFKALRVKKNNTNLLTGEPLVKPNETVKDFENRINK